MRLHTRDLRQKAWDIPSHHGHGHHCTAVVLLLGMKLQGRGALHLRLLRRAPAVHHALGRRQRQGP